jgi:hypothetical protein
MASQNPAVFAENQGSGPKKMQLSQTLFQFFLKCASTMRLPSAAYVARHLLNKIALKTYRRFSGLPRFWQSSPVNILFCESSEPPSAALKRIKTRSIKPFSEKMPGALRRVVHSVHFVHHAHATPQNAPNYGGLRYLQESPKTLSRPPPKIYRFSSLLIGAIAFIQMGRFWCPVCGCTLVIAI